MPATSSPSDYDCIECDASSLVEENVTVLVATGHGGGFEFGLCPECRRQFAAQLLVHDDPEAPDEVPR